MDRAELEQALHAACVAQDAALDAGDIEKALAFWVPIFDLQAKLRDLDDQTR
jgi:hypothetical protein